MTDAEKTAFEWLVKQHKKANAAMRRAETKQNNDHEKRGLKRKIDILQWLIYRLQLGAGHTHCIDTDKLDGYKIPVKSEFARWNAAYTRGWNQCIDSLKRSAREDAEEDNT